MSNHSYSGSARGLKIPKINLDKQRKLIVGIILLMALLAFEIFNFDTTQFALQSLLGDVRFLGILWATILAIAFCSIDFAGLVRLFNPEGTSGANKEGWYLMGAWLLGATMNAVMTWWAVSLTLLNNNFGNEVLSREELLRYVPIFVAVLVWLTRILFIGAFSIAGAQLFESSRSSRSRIGGNTKTQSSSSAGRSRKTAPSRLKAAPKPKPLPQTTHIEPQSSTSQASTSQPAAPSSQPTSQSQRTSRVRNNRPPVPNGGLRKPGSRIQARIRN